MDVRDFEYELPGELIAQEPPAERTAARLLVLRRESGEIEHSTIGLLPDLLTPGDLVVVNNTRVFPARLLGRRVPTGGVVECLLIRRLDDERWEALMHPGQKLRPGARARFEGPPGIPPIVGEVLSRHFHGRRVVRFRTESGSPVNDAIDAIGHVPLPPYIKRSDRREDRERYQTVFARARGSVAAPTAGLHFDRALVTALAARGVEIAEITLHVGYGTFQPVRVERVEEHNIEPEQFAIDASAAAAINRAIDSGRRIIAVGTTTTRALEHVARVHDGRVAQGGAGNAHMAPGSGETNLFIFPGFEFRVIRGLLTNFHLPRSSLLMLVCAFAGRDRVLAAYRAAVAKRYRFYSYGDAMLIL